MRVDTNNTASIMMMENLNRIPNMIFLIINFFLFIAFFDRKNRQLIVRFARIKFGNEKIIYCRKGKT